MKGRLFTASIFLFLLTAFIFQSNGILLALDTQQEIFTVGREVKASVNKPPIDMLDPQPEPPMGGSNLQTLINKPPIDMLDPQPEPPIGESSIQTSIDKLPIDMLDPQPEPPIGESKYQISIDKLPIDALDPQPEPPMIARDIKILINNIPYDALDPQPEPPMLFKNRTLVPMRTIFEKLGANVAWDDTTRTITVKKGTTVITMKPGVASAIVNGQTVTLEVPSLIYNNRTFVPLRFVSQALGNDVKWNDQTRTVSIN